MADFERAQRRREAVRGAIGAIAGSLGIDVSNATEQVWLQLFGDVDAEELQRATVLVLATWKYPRVPPPALVREALFKLRDRQADIAASAIECHDCSGVGLIYRNLDRHNRVATVMVPCSCALGAGKRIWLNQERKKGFADNAHSFRDQAATTAADVAPEQETIPF